MPNAFTENHFGIKILFSDDTTNLKLWITGSIIMRYNKVYDIWGAV